MQLTVNPQYAWDTADITCTHDVYVIALAPCDLDM